MADAPKPPDEFHVISPDGTYGTVPSSDINSALQQGYRLATGDEIYKNHLAAAYDQPVVAGAESAARALTFGGSDLLQAGAGLRSQRDLSLEKQLNPAASTAGEVVGTAAGLLTGAGPLGAISEAGNAVKGISALGKVGGTIAAGATEGGLFGLGNAISESALGDSELTAEKLLASGGIGAALGGAGGAASELVGAGVRKAIGAAKGSLSGMSGEELQNALKDFAEKRAVVAGGAMSRDLKGLQYRGQLNERGRFMLDNGLITPGASLDTIAERAGAKRQATGQRLGELADMFDQSAQPGERISGPAIADKIQSELVDPLMAGNSADQSLAKRIANEAEVARSKGDMSFKEAEAYKRSFDKHLTFDAEQGPIKEQMKQVRGMVRQAVDDSAEKIAGRLGDGSAEEWQQLKNDYGHLKGVEDIASKRSAAIEANRMASPTDYGATVTGFLGGLTSGHGVGVSGLGGMALGAANKALRKYGDSIMATGADALADSPLFQKIAGAFSKDLGAKLESSPEAFGQFSNILRQASAKGADDLLATHIQLAKADPEYRAVIAKAGYEPEADMGGVARQLGQLEAVHAANDRFDSKADASIGRFLGTQGGARPLFGSDLGDMKTRQENFAKQMDGLTQMVTNAQQMAQQLGTGDLANYAPATAAALGAQASKAAQFLQSKAPKNPDSEIMPALQTPWKPSFDQMLKFDRYVKAVNDPMAVMDDLRRGVVTPESVEAMRTVYPKLLSDLQEKMMTRLQGYSGTLSPQQRNAIQTLFGAQTRDTTATFQQIHQQAAAQKAAQDQAAAQNAMAGPQKPPIKPPALATPAQQMEAR